MKKDTQPFTLDAIDLENIETFVSSDDKIVTLTWDCKVQQLKTIAKIVWNYELFTEKEKATLKKDKWVLLGKHYSTNWKALYSLILSQEQTYQFDFFFEKDCFGFRYSEHPVSPFSELFIYSKTGAGAYNRLQNFLNTKSLVDNYNINWPGILCEIKLPALMKLAGSAYLRHKTHEAIRIDEKLKVLIQNPNCSKESIDCFIEYILETKQVEEGAACLFALCDFGLCLELLGKQAVDLDIIKNINRLYKKYITDKDKKSDETLSELETIAKLAQLSTEKNKQQYSNENWHKLMDYFYTNWYDFFLKILNQKNISPFKSFFTYLSNSFSKKYNTYNLVNGLTNLFIEQKGDSSARQRLDTFLSNDFLVDKFYIYWDKLLPTIGDEKLFVKAAKQYLMHNENKDVSLNDKIKILLQNRSYQVALINMFFGSETNFGEPSQILVYLFTEMGFDSCISIIEKSSIQNFDSMSYLITIASGESTFSGAAALYLFNKSVLPTLSLETLLKILKNNISKGVAQSILEILTDRFSTQLVTHTDKFKEILSSGHPFHEVSQILLENEWITNIISTDYLYKQALESKERAPYVIPLVKMDEQKVWELAKKHPSVREQIINSHTNSEIKFSIDSIKQFYKLTDNLESTKILILEQLFRTEVIEIWIDLFKKINMESQKKVVETWIKLPSEKTVTYLELLYNYSFLKGTTLSELCKLYPFFTQWIIPIMQESKLISCNIKGEIERLHSRYELEQIQPKKDQISKKEVLDFFAAMNDIKDVFHSNTLTSRVSFYLLNSSTSTSTTSRYSETSEGDSEEKQSKFRLENLNPKKQEIFILIGKIDFFNGYLTDKGLLQVCATILTLLHKGVDYEQRYDKATTGKENFSKLKKLVVDVHIFSNEKKEEPRIKAINKETDSFGLSILKEYYQAIGFCLGNDYSLQKPPQNRHLPPPEAPLPPSSLTDEVKDEDLCEPGLQQSLPISEYQLVYNEKHEFIGVVSEQKGAYIPKQALERTLKESKEFINSFSLGDRIKLQKIFTEIPIYTPPSAPPGPYTSGISPLVKLSALQSVGDTPTLQVTDRCSVSLNNYS